MCKKDLKRFGNHIEYIHGITIDVYAKLYLIPSYSIKTEYEINKKSAQQIANEIKKLTDKAWSPIKTAILKILREEGVVIRDTSQAITEWSALQGGPWNKNLTKKDHPSIQQYADKRLGKDNSFFNTDPAKRIDSYYTRITPEEASIVRDKISDTLKRKFRSGEIKKLSPEFYKQNLTKALLVLKKQFDDGTWVPPTRRTSVPEKKIGLALKSLNLNHQDQYHIGWHVFDFYLPQYSLIIEFNGTYWHCDPRKYSHDFYHTLRKKTAEKIWEKDEKKKQKVIAKNLELLVIWEEDIKHLTTDELKTYVDEAIKNKINNKGSVSHEGL